MGMTKAKIAVSLPQEQVAAAKRAVAEGRVASVSAYVSQALEKYDARTELMRLLDERDEKYGPPTPEDEAWADDVMAKIEQLRRQGGYPPR